MSARLHQAKMLDSVALTSDWLSELADSESSLRNREAVSLLLQAALAPESDDQFAHPAILRVAEANGTPFTFRSEHEAVVQEVISDDLMSSSSAGTQALGFHTDFGVPLHTPWSHWGFRPDVITLLCLAAPTSVPVTTTVVAAEEIVNTLPSSIGNILFQANYSFPVSYSMESTSLHNRTWSEPGPIFRSTDDGIEVAVDLPTLKRHAQEPTILERVATTKHAFQALLELLEFLDKENLGSTVPLTAGSLLVFSNVHAVHARSEHTSASTEPRRLLRVYSTYDGGRLQAAGNAVNVDLRLR